MIGWRKQESSRGSVNTLTIINATLQDAGVYTCSAVQLSRFHSNFDEFNINVTVHRKRHFLFVVILLISSFIFSFNTIMLGLTHSRICTSVIKGFFWWDLDISKTKYDYVV